MAATKLDWRFLKRKHLATMKAHKYETAVWTTKMTGMMARSVNFSAVSCDPSFVKTGESDAAGSSQDTGTYSDKA